MGRNIDDVIQGLPAARQAKIAKLADEKIRDMLAHAATLTDFRKAVGKTQSEVAKELGINQNAVSQLEKRSDTYVSTLRRFLGSLGMTLELSVVAKNGVRIDLPNFLQSSEDSQTGKAFAAPPKVSGRKPSAKAALIRKTATKTTRDRKLPAKAAISQSASRTIEKKTESPQKRASGLRKV